MTTYGEISFIPDVYLIFVKPPIYDHAVKYASPKRTQIIKFFIFHNLLSQNTFLLVHRYRYHVENNDAKSYSSIETLHWKESLSRWIPVSKKDGEIYVSFLQYVNNILINLTIPNFMTPKVHILFIDINLELLFLQLVTNMISLKF